MKNMDIEARKQHILLFLKEYKNVYKIGPIGKETGISVLDKVVNGRPDGRGYISTLADEHVPVLEAYLKKIAFK